MSRFQKLIRFLKKNKPAAYPIYVKTKAIALDEGKCYFSNDNNPKKRFFQILIDPTKCENCKINTLIHEWAHAIAWNHAHDMQENLSWHGPEWGIAYSQVYEIYEKFIESDNS